MSGWNYRLVNVDGYISVHEVYYSDKGVPNSRTVHPVPPGGETEKEVHAAFELYKKAFEKPVLEDFPDPDEDDEDDDDAW